jgi:CubicO group peptidase (beta-lactamase class C family)
MLHSAAWFRLVAFVIVLALLPVGVVAKQDALPLPVATPLPPATPVAVGEGEFVDPNGRFVVPLPAGWTASLRGDVGVLTSPERGINIYLLTMPVAEIPAAIEAAWLRVDPTFDVPVTKTLHVPAIFGMTPFTLLEYGAPADESIQAIGRSANDVVFVALMRGDRDEAVRRASQIQNAALGIELAGEVKQSVRGIAPRTLTAELLARIDDYVQQAMERFQIPGAAYAIVQDGKIVHAAGFGVREAGTLALVTPETMMLAGSVTKPMTTTYMATLVDDGLLRWDQPVVEILPSFAVADPEVTNQLVVSDLVCGCTGVPKRDLELVFAGDDLTPADVIASLREIGFFTDVGEAFQYSNQMAAAGGYVAAIASGGSLETALDDYVAGMEERLFRPVGMVATTFSEAEAVASGNYALPHARTLDGAVTTFPLALEANVETVAPAGGVWTNVLDLGNFVQTLLNWGVTANGERVVTTAGLGAIWAPRVPVSGELWYGLGWMVSAYKEQPLLYHTGGTLGYNAEISLLPESGLGVAILANQSNVLAFHEAVRTRVFESAFDQPAEGDAAVDFMVAQTDELFADLNGKVMDVDPAEVAQFLGVWKHPSLGELTLSLSDGRLTANTGVFVTELVALAEGPEKEALYVTATPPFVGLRVAMQDQDGALSVIVNDPASADPYVFTKANSLVAAPAS